MGKDCPFIKRKGKRFKKGQWQEGYFYCSVPSQMAAAISSLEQTVVWREAERHTKLDRYKWLAQIDEPNAWILMTLSIKNFPNWAQRWVTKKWSSRTHRGLKTTQTGLDHTCSFRRGLWSTLNVADWPEGRKRFTQMLVFQCLQDSSVATTGFEGMES